MKPLFLIPLMAAALLVSAPSTSAQVRDYLTNEEIEIIRDEQEIDDRINVLIRAIDRRFAALGIDVQAVSASKSKDGEDKWGKLPAGTRIELLSDIRKILQKAIDDLDNISERPDSAILPDPNDKRKKPKTVAELFPIAVRALSSASERFATALSKEGEKAVDRTERSLIATTLDMCEQVIDAAKRLPSPPAKSKN